MADKQKMSVAEMLAAARAEKNAGAAVPTGPNPVPEPPDDAALPATEPAAQIAEPVTPAKPAAKPAKGLSVADMLAAARGEKSVAAPPAAAVAKPAAAPAAKPAVVATATKAPLKPVAEKAGVPATKDTASILASVRRTSKPGPVSKTAVAAPAAKPGKTKLEVPPMPERPSYVRPVPATTATEGPTRRGFVAGWTAATAVLFGSALALGFTSLAVTGVLWTLGLARFMFPNVLIEPPTKFKVGFPDDYAPGQVQTKFIAQFGVWVVRYEYEGTPIIYAIKSVCTHLGCTPNWLEGEQKFKCPCHGSGFYKDGINFEGPAPRPLERYVIHLADDGQLEIDKSRTFQEELGQWKDVASYVTV